MSDTAWFETAKLGEPFARRAHFTVPACRHGPVYAPRVPCGGRGAFRRAYFTGLGVYELYVNGEKAGDEYLAPGCTAYDRWIQYQTYDVTDLVKNGENVVGAVIGNGWAKGRFGFDGKAGCYETNDPGSPHNIFTDEYLLLGELHITTDRGETVVVTDERWQSAPAPLTFGSIYDGERYDARLEIENWRRRPARSTAGSR